MSNENIFLAIFAAVLFAVIAFFVGVIVGSIYRKITDTVVPVIFIYLLSFILTILFGGIIISDGSMEKTFGKAITGLLFYVFFHFVRSGIKKSNKNAEKNNVAN